MLILALLLASAQADPAEPLLTAYAECLVERAKVRDDRLSDAATVAEIVRLDCRAQERAAAVALAGDVPNYGTIVVGIERDGLSRAVRAVLRVRAGK